MGERSRLLSDLYCEVLGPRSGPFEELPQEEPPLDEYITGVLSPRALLRSAEGASSRDVEDEFEGAEPLMGEGEGDAGPDVGTRAETPDPLDARDRPASMGLSFVCESRDGQPPTFDVAVTFGTYALTEQKSWQRTPHGWTERNVSKSVNSPLDVEGLTLRVLVRDEPLDPRRRRVSISLVNERKGDDRSAAAYIFQPQIRIKLNDATALAPLERAARAIHADDRRLAALYRDRLTFARGFLCSATWGSLDPECGAPELREVDGQKLPYANWLDGLAVWGDSGPEIVERFSPADLRTEFIPMVAVTAPERVWRSEFGTTPTLDPIELSELFDGTRLQRALEPLLNGYDKWIESERLVCASLPEKQRTALEHQLDAALSVRDRIAEGIHLLATDDDVRRAFCFANKAIALQSAWSKRSSEQDAPSPLTPNQWFPFQLAFQLMSICGLVSPDHRDREICDLLWFPTGGGKTEAYLGVAAFLLAYRRISSLRNGTPLQGAGTGVISRYTLKLLTIQQFRRAVGLVTACEFLRNSICRDGSRGWRPTADVETFSENPWGEIRFSIGLWVGAGVTPQDLHDFQYKNEEQKLVTVFGAVSRLERRDTSDFGGEPAQLASCPACTTTLAVQGQTLADGRPHTLHFVVSDALPPSPDPSIEGLSSPTFSVQRFAFTPLANGYLTLSITFVAQPVADDMSGPVSEWWRTVLSPALGKTCELVAADASRPGYFVRTTETGSRPYEFEVFCPSPTCALSTCTWFETLPAGPWLPPAAFRSSEKKGTRCPIPIWTVDSQIYHRVPSMIVATVDKFARLAFESRTSSMFGNVSMHHGEAGWYRTYCTPNIGKPPPAIALQDLPNSVPVGSFLPPDLIIQDELHLIEGPLGTMVGLYETAIDQLAARSAGDRVVGPKYVSSTATVREAEAQVKSLFARDLSVFPVNCTTIDDSFFSSSLVRPHPLSDESPGRLYVGLAAPGRSGLTPTVRVWSRILQSVELRRRAGAELEDLDGFWTLVGYFNAIRELANVRTICEQDIPQRMASYKDPRLFEVTELSSRTSPEELPAHLDELSRRIEDEGIDVLLTTSMFGTGVDVSRLRLMYVYGQPKTTSSYIQATGRVGRQRGGLVITFLRAGRPRDLNQYEYFVGYHDAIYRHVEPITVSPFAEGARERGLGPLCVALLRLGRGFLLNGSETRVTGDWRTHERLKKRRFSSSASLMATRRHDVEVTILPTIFEARASQQPEGRRPAHESTRDHVAAALDLWEQRSRQTGTELVYNESTMVKAAEHHVVLGDLAHEQATSVVFRNAPNSLREVEATVTFAGRS